MEWKLIQRFHFDGGLRVQPFGRRPRLQAQCVVAPFFKVREPMARVFALTLLENIVLRNQRLGKAVTDARDQLFNSGEPQALAYALIGNPFAFFADNEHEQSFLPVNCKIVELHVSNHQISVATAIQTDGGVGKERVAIRSDLQKHPYNINLPFFLQGLQRQVSRIQTSMMTNKLNTLKELLVEFTGSLFDQQEDFYRFSRDMIEFDFIVFVTDKFEIPWHLIALDGEPLALRKSCSVFWPIRYLKPILEDPEGRGRLVLPEFFKNPIRAIKAYVLPQNGKIAFDAHLLQVVEPLTHALGSGLDLLELRRRFCRLAFMKARDEYHRKLVYLCAHGSSQGIGLPCCLREDEREAVAKSESLLERTAHRDLMLPCPYYAKSAVCSLEEVQREVNAEAGKCSDECDTEPSSRLDSMLNCIADLTVSNFDFSTFKDTFLFLNCCEVARG